MIALTPSHGRAECAERPSKTTRATRLPRHPSCKRVVGRLETDDELRLVDDRRLREDAGQRVLVRPELLPREEQQPEVVGEVDAVGPAGELDHHAEPALHVARPETDDRAVLEPGRQVALRRDRVRVAREQDERLPGSLGVEERLPVREDELERHRLLDVCGYGGLVPRLGGDVDELERALGEQGVGV